jgi:hypothetical protein
LGLYLVLSDPEIAKGISLFLFATPLTQLT